MCEYDLAATVCCGPTPPPYVLVPLATAARHIINESVHVTVVYTLENCAQTTRPIVYLFHIQFQGPKRQFISSGKMGEH